MKVVTEAPAASPSLFFLPEFIREFFLTVTTIFRTARKGSEATERLVDGIDVLATKALKQQAAAIDRKLIEQ